MAQGSQGEGLIQQGQGEGGRLFGVPLGRLGLFSRLLIGAATAFAAFFAATFLGIVGILVYNSAMHQTVDLALSYQRGGLVVGIVTLVVAWGVLGTMWVRRVTRGA
ncbi:hypothetical protein [Edaphobacter aggregans]|uniref:hypothetical protein n=1 Tax=Edaphobacter aggregans TaxID=570835 RepID=UPI0005536F9E|nr:hypothetical protein [Edaphobacter aggregans]